MANFAVEEYELFGDPKYRSYVSAIDKVLKNFESTSEWADLISALGKLNKVLLSHIKQPVIPRRIIISKRLAQCMHPALPGGVHLKALETYDIIFKCIKTNRLSQELFIYSAGLFPLLSYAATNVRQALLKIYEIHFVPLEKKLRPGLPGFLIGVLPGLEEGAEYYERTNTLLENVSSGVGEDYFFGCLWECVLANTTIRLPAITYVYTHFNRKVNIEDQLYLMGTNVDVMVKALCSAVQDNNVLVQRSTLDFLLVTFPMHSDHLIRSDMVKLLSSAVCVVLRRDMSLNRRLYSWLLSNGSNTSERMCQNAGELSPPPGRESLSSDSDVNNYFDIYSRSVLIQALCNCLKNNEVVSIAEHGSPQLRPYRLLISLLDKPEIGTAVLDDILLDVFRSLYGECHFTVHGQGKDDKGQAELMKAANLLFGTLESSYIWEYLGHHFSKFCEELDIGERTFKTTCDTVQPVGSGRPNVVELCLLTEFLLDFVSVETYVEIQAEHLPKLLRQLATMLSSSCEVLLVRDIIHCLNLCSRLLSKIQPIITPPPPPNYIGNSSNSNGSGSTVSQIASSGVAGNSQVVIDVLNLSNSQTFQDGSSGSLGGKLSPEHEESNYNSSLNNATNVMHMCGSKPCSLSPALRSKWNERITNVASDCPMKEPQNMLRSCLTTFQECFVKLLTSRVLDAGLDSQGILERLLEVQKDDDKERQHVLEQWLRKMIQENDPILPSYHDSPRIRSEHRSNRYDFHHVRLSLANGATEFLDAFSIACRILVDFSSFPACFIPSGQTFDSSISQSPEYSPVPEWLRLLLVISCFVQEMDFQLIAIGTVLELMALTQSYTAATRELSLPEKIHGTFSLLIDPVLEPSHLHFLHQHTIFCQIVARILWQYVDESHTSSLRKCVELLHQLHSLAPDGSVVEDVIGESMAEDDEKMQVKSVQKFAVLWHLTRGLPNRACPMGKVRLLDRSLLVTLNCLLKPYGPQRAEVSSWLNHSLQRGDVGGILEPILLILMHPDTARVSVQHVSIHSSGITKNGDVDDERDDNCLQTNKAKIFAISSVEGRVIYHVGSHDSYSIDDRFSLEQHSSSSTNSRRIFALASVAGDNTECVVTANATLRDFDLPSSLERTVQEPISMFINPLVDSSLLSSNIGSPPENSGSDAGTIMSSVVTPTDISQAHRIDVSALRNSQSFDDIDSISLKSDTFTPSSSYSSCSMDSKVMDIVKELLQDIIDTVVGNENYDNERSEKIGGMEDRTEWDDLRDVSIHPLHTYLLLYTQCYDSGRVLYAFSTLKAILQSNPRLAVCTLATTSIGSSRSPRQSLLYELLARHRKAMFGKNFQGELGSEALTAFRSSMFLEILISLCLYYLRSYYPNLAHMRLTEEDLTNNWEVQLLAIDVLTLLFAEVATVVRDSAKGFASYISNLLAKCKVQKTLLHCVLSGVFLLDRQKSSSSPSDSFQRIETFTEAIIHFNEKVQLREGEKRLYWDYQETFQISMLRLLLVLIILEDQLANQKSDIDVVNVGGNPDTLHSSPSQSKSHSPLRYQPGLLIPCQPIFQTAVLTALKQPYTSLLHRHWLGLLSCALPFLRKALSSIVVSAVSQLCCNLEDLATLYDSKIKPTHMKALPPKIPPLSHSKGRKVPVDHVILHLEGLTTLCHYCLLESTSLISTILTHSTNAMTSQPLMSGPNATQIISNLINVFVPSVIHRDMGDNKDKSHRMDPIVIARHNLLGKLPRLVSSLTTLWQAVNNSTMAGSSQAAWVMGTPKVIQQLILELLSPLSHHHGVNFLATIAVVWYEKRSQHAQQILPVWSPDQLVLVELVRAIKIMPIDMLVQLVRQVLKQPPIISSKGKSKMTLEVTLLQFFYAYVQATPAGLMNDAWSSLQTLIKDCFQVNNFPPQALFMLMGIFNEFVQRMPALQDRKEQKELQDLTQKLVEACVNVASASLEQTTWLRRSFAVKPGPQVDDAEVIDPGPLFSSSPVTKGVLSGKSINCNTASNSVQALSLLAELLAPLLDVVYLSDEKEKATPLLNSVMCSVTPYLRNHYAHNVPSFRACSQLLASLSEYQYTRKAWRRDVFDLLLDPAFFQMDAGCMQWWRTIIDNLMTHDKTTFSDLMARVSIAQSGSLNLFSGKEQEYEQRAQLLKRLAFVIFCSEVDQYQSFMPEIQERLSESMRLPQVPAIEAQVFLCFRVLLLRMSPQHITSLWPIIITEMVQVFLQIEQELCRHTEEFKRKQLPSSHLRRLSQLDSSWVVSSNNGLNAHSHPAWLQLYLSVCKLLDLGLCLPADRLPQFQMYSWAFVGGSSGSFDDCCDEEDSKRSLESKSSATGFVPHVVRLARHLETEDCASPVALGALNRQYETPLLNVRQINTLSELYPFFKLVSMLHNGNRHRSHISRNNSKDASSDSRNVDPSTVIESLMEAEFLEPLPTVSS